MMDSDSLTGLRAQYYYQYVQILKMMLRYKGDFALVESPNGDDGGSERLHMFHLDVVGLHMETMAEGPILIRTASPFLENQIRSALFHKPTFYNSMKVFLRSQRLCSSITIQTYSNAELVEL